jgi:hypothetical protein
VLGRLGKTDDARVAAEQCIASNPLMTPTYYAELMAVFTDQRHVIERRTQGLRSVGLLAAG